MIIKATSCVSTLLKRTQCQRSIWSFALYALYNGLRLIKENR